MQEQPPERRYRDLPTDELAADVSQVRRSLPKEDLQRMVDSVKALGIFQPIRVRWDKQRELWVIISGETRWRSAKIAGLQYVPCQIVEGELTDCDILEEQIVENVVRNDLRPMQLANALAKLRRLKKCTLAMLATELGISAGTIAKSEALLNLPVEIQAMVDEGTVPETTAYHIARHPDRDAMKVLAEAVAAGKLKREEVADQVNAALNSNKPAKTPSVRLACKLDGVSITVSGGGLTVKALLKAIEQLRQKAKALEEGADIAALAKSLQPTL